ncbi:UDP-glucose 4-epimerase family protein [Methylovorus glucosotrophus]|uniref:NAD-dependent epimerase/dehydratase n=1 Tax=Methylovorus glucosotrophus (strain SIP3-4) TaxID=582744 RepID=C6X8A3_METGS|nr:SDR family oxidoreductase [Methylovorus glucosotrophus]ACT49373.1 NAD-dependent epimerase/dehydratase [Methylovorus glucosotrophus SIP3-4]
MTSRIAITGATGFVGKGLLAYLQQAGMTIVEIGRRPAAQESTFFQMESLGPESDFGDALLGCDSVVHLAARVHVMRDTATDPLAAFREVNLHGTLNLARQAATAGVRRFVYLSSVKVNGDSGAFCENDMPAPKDAYAQSKWEAEQALVQLSSESDMEIVIIRPPLIYGPGVKGNFSSLLSWVSHGIPLPLGAIKNRRSLLALDNLIDFIVLCLDQERSPHAANETFLVSDQDDVSTTELLRRVAHAYGMRPRLIPVPAGLLKTSARVLGKSAVSERLLDSLTVDMTKARVLLGWQPIVTMQEQLQKMATLEADEPKRLQRSRS